MNHIKVKDHATLLRDTNTRAIINNDRSGFKTALEAKNRILNDKKQLSDLKDRVEFLEYALNQLLDKME